MVNCITDSYGNIDLARTLAANDPSMMTEGSCAPDLSVPILIEKPPKYLKSSIISDIDIVSKTEGTAKGLQFGLFISEARQGLKGLQMALAANEAHVDFCYDHCSAKDDRVIHGGQIAFAMNIVFDAILKGAQIAVGANSTDHGLVGAQVALVSNMNHHSYIKGAQVGLININWAKNHYIAGAQIGAVNLSNDSEIMGGQVSIYNSAAAVYGGQVGVLNVSKTETKGTQVGLFNWTKGEFIGLQIGFINSEPPYILFGVGW